MYDYDAELEVKTFGDFDEAVFHFNNIVEYCRNEAQEENWVIDEDTAQCFSSCEEGDATRNHAYVKLQISEVKINYL